MFLKVCLRVKPCRRILKQNGFSGSTFGKYTYFHFLLHCTTYNEERSHSTHLQHPYIESDEDILRRFPFNKEDIEEKKELLFAMEKN